MTSRLDALCIDANDPVLLARFWSRALQRELHDDRDEISLVPTDGTRFRILFESVPEEKAGRNRRHLDIVPVHGDQRAEVHRLVSLGASRVDIGQGDVSWVVMADLDGYEFCVLDPG